MTTVTTVIEAIPNHPTLDDLVKEARELGRDKASGDDSLAKLALKVVRAASEGVLDLQKDKHDPGVDDAKMIYTAFAEAKSRKAIHEHTDTGVKANVSKLRAIVKLGLMTTCDPVGVLDRAVNIHRVMSAGDEKIKPAYAGYVDVARAQVAAGEDGHGDLSDDEIKGAMRKKEAEDPTPEKIIEGVVKRLEKLIAGECGCKDQSEEVTSAYDALRQRLAALIIVRERDEKLARLAELETLRAELGEFAPPAPSLALARDLGAEQAAA